MVHGKNRIPYWIDRRLTGLAGPDDDAAISFGLPFESEDCQYGKSWSRCFMRQKGRNRASHHPEGSEARASGYGGKCLNRVPHQHIGIQ